MLQIEILTWGAVYQGWSNESLHLPTHACHEERANGNKHSDRAPPSRDAVFKWYQSIHIGMEIEKLNDGDGRADILHKG